MKKSKESFKGVAAVNFTVGTKNPVFYRRGDSFETSSEKVYNSLINAKKIK